MNRERERLSAATDFAEAFDVTESVRRRRCWRAFWLPLLLLNGMGEWRRRRRAMMMMMIVSGRGCGAACTRALHDARTHDACGSEWWTDERNVTVKFAQLSNRMNNIEFLWNNFVNDFVWLESFVLIMINLNCWFGATHGMNWHSKRTIFVKFCHTKGHLNTFWWWNCKIERLAGRVLVNCLGAEGSTFSSISFHCVFPLADPRPEISLPNEQYMYPNRINAFDPNLCSAAEYSPPPPASYASTTDASVTYSNVIFLPTIALSDRAGDDVDGVKNETAAMESSQPYKYVVASDCRYTNTFATRNGEIEENISEINHINGYVEPTAPHMISNASSGDCEENLVYQTNAVEHHGQYPYIGADYMHHSRDKHCRSDAGIVLQCANGQLYRYVNGDTINSSVELMPTLIPDAMVDGIGYAQHESYDHPNEHSAAYEMHPNIDGALSAEKQGHHSNSGSDLIYDYKEQSQQYTMLESIDQNNVIRDGGGMHPGEAKTNYPSKCSLEKDQQRILLESTMSPLRKFSCVIRVGDSWLITAFSFSGRRERYNRPRGTISVVFGTEQSRSAQKYGRTELLLWKWRRRTHHSAASPHRWSAFCWQQIENDTRCADNVQIDFHGRREYADVVRIARRWIRWHQRNGIYRRAEWRQRGEFIDATNASEENGQKMRRM